MMEITRRSLLAATTLAALGTALKPAGANAPVAGKQAAGVYRYKIGDFEMTALYDGVWHRPIDESFVRNAPFEAVQKALADSFLSTDKLPIPFTTSTPGRSSCCSTPAAPARSPRPPAP